MAEPTLALSFEDMIIRVAEYLGVAYYGADGTEIAQLPTDAHDLDVCKRLVNDGWRRFVNSNPHWQWLMPTFSITMVPAGDGTGDNIGSADGSVPAEARYHLPDGFYGQMLSKFTYPSGGPRIDVENVSEGEIRQLYSGAGSTSGDPYLAAIRPLSTSVGAYAKRWEAIFFPAPDTAHELTARCRLYPNKLVENDDRHNAGVQHDEAVLAAAMAEAERQREDSAGVKNAMWAEALTRSIAMDQKSAPRRLGYNADGSHGADLRNRRYYTGVDTYNGNAV